MTNFDVGNGERGKKWIENEDISSFSLHFLILSPFPLRFLSISSFSLHFLAARLQGCNDSCSPATTLIDCMGSKSGTIWDGFARRHSIVYFVWDVADLPAVSSHISYWILSWNIWQLTNPNSKSQLSRPCVMCISPSKTSLTCGDCTWI